MLHKYCLCDYKTYNCNIFISYIYSIEGAGASETTHTDNTVSKINLKNKIV